MYQAPCAERTDAWKPIGLRSAWMVALGSSSPRPEYVLISGCLRARPGAMIADSASAKRWNEPPGEGRETTTGWTRASRVNSCGAPASTFLRLACWSVNEFTCPVKVSARFMLACPAVAPFQNVFVAWVSRSDWCAPAPAASVTVTTAPTAATAAPSAARRTRLREPCSTFMTLPSIDFAPAQGGPPLPQRRACRPGMIPPAHKRHKQVGVELPRRPAASSAAGALDPAQVGERAQLPDGLRRVCDEVVAGGLPRAVRAGELQAPGGDGVADARPALAAVRVPKEAGAREAARPAAERDVVHLDVHSQPAARRAPHARVRPHAAHVHGPPADDDPRRHRERAEPGGAERLRLVLGRRAGRRHERRSRRQRGPDRLPAH